MSSAQSYFDTLQAVYTDRLNRKNGYVEIPTLFFVGKIDVQMPDLPEIAFYLLKGEKTELLKQPKEIYSSLALSLHDVIWIKEEDLEVLRRFAESIILKPSDSAGVLSSDKRMEILRRSAMTVVEDLFLNPSPKNIARSTKVVRSFVYVMMKDPKAYLLLIKLSSHDPYTLQHSVGTAVNSIILGRKLGITNEQELCDLGLAGLLHDIGKVKIKTEIINKPGPLSEDEWVIMRQHSQFGYDILKQSPQISEKTKLAVLEHHEDKNGTGYPNGLKSHQMDLYSKIVALADIFNALTTDRPYCKARSAFDAFQFIRDKLSHKVEDDIFKELVIIYGGKIEI
jgi:HD-GYP domain-containing protein (c-di-GMP phosphodiesterase class II)